MKIELFYAPGCEKCDANWEALKSAAQEAAPGLEWHDLNVMENMDYAVELGVLTLPAMAIDGTLEFPSLPNAKQLVKAIARKTCARQRA